MMSSTAKRLKKKKTTTTTSSMTTTKPILDFKGHTHWVWSVAFSPNGQYALTGSSDKTAKLWNVNDGKVVHTFQGHTNYVTSIAFSPNGQYVLTGSVDKTAKLWNVNDGKVVHTFQGHTNWVNSVAFSPNGQYVLTGSDDKTAKLWNVNDGKVVHIFQGHTNVTSIAFSPDGQYVLTGSWDRTTKLWNVNDGKVVHTFQGHTNSVMSVAFSPNGQYVLTGSFDNTAKLWNVNDGTAVHTLQGHTDSVMSVAFSPNGQYVLTGSVDKTSKLWNVNDGKVVHTFQRHTDSVASVAFSPNGRYVLTGSTDKTAKLWQLPKSVVAPTNRPESVSPLSTFNLVSNPQQTVQTLTSHLDPSNPSISNHMNSIPTPDPVPNTTATNNLSLQAYDSVNIALLNKLHESMTTTKPILNFKEHTHWVWSVAFSPNGQYALTGSSDKTAKLWNVNDGKVVHTFQGHTNYVTSIAFSPNGQYVLTGSVDKTAKLWNVNDGKVVHTFQGHTNWVNSVAFSPNGQYVLTGSDDKTARLWNVNDGKVVHIFQGHTNVTSIAFSPDGQYVLTGSWDRTTKLWNVNDGKVVHTFQGHTNYVMSVAFSPNGQYVLTGSFDNTAKLWNVNDGTAVHTLQGHTDSVMSVAFSPNGQYVLTGSVDKTSKLWNVNDGKVVHTFQRHTDSVASVAFSPNGRYVLTGSTDKSAKLWQLPKSVVAPTNRPESVSPLSTFNLVSNPQQTVQTLTSHLDPSNPSISNHMNSIPTPDPVPNTTATNNLSLQAYDSVNIALLNKLHESMTTTKPILDFKGHASWVWSVAFSPNGQYALTGSFDRTAKLWNVNDGKVVHTFQGHTDYVRPVAFSPNGQYVLTGSSDKTAKLWNVNDGKVVHTFQGHTDSVASVAFSPNGQYVLTGSGDKTTKLWNVNNGKVIHTFQGHTSSVRSVAFSPDGQYVLTGSSDKTAKLWNVNDGKVVHTFQGHTDSVMSVAFSPNGQYVLTGSYDKTAKLWNVNDGTVVHTFQGHTNYVRSVAFSPDGQYALTGSFDKTTKLWNVNNGKVVHTFQGHTRMVTSVAFSPNGQHVLTGSGDDTAKLWQLPESIVASTNHLESVSPLSTSNGVSNPQQTVQTFTSHSDHSNPSISNHMNSIPTTDPVPNTTATNNLSLQAYDSVNVALLNKLHAQGDRFLDIINNTTTMESDMYELLSQYPKELQSLLYEKSQSVLEKKELNDIMISQEHYQFYTHLIRKLKGMMTACETINSGMVSQADMSFQDYVHGLVKEGAWAALQQIELGKVFGGVIQWAKKQFASVPFTDAIGSFFQMACEYKTKRDQHLAIGRVAIMSALADLHEHDRGCVNGTVHRIGRYIVRAEANQLSLLESDEFGRIQKLWTKAMGESADTPAKERGCNVADLVIGVIMNPTKNTDLYNILEGHTINQSASLDEIIAAAALEMSIEDIQNLEYFSSEEDNTDDSNSSPSNLLSQQCTNMAGSSNAGGVVHVVDTDITEKKTNALPNMDVASKEAMDEMKKEVEMLRKKVAKLEKGNKGTEVDVGGGLAQEYVNPHETSGQETSVMRRIDRLDKRLMVMETNQLEANRTIVEHEERLGTDVPNTNISKKKGFLRKMNEKRKLKNEKEKRQRGELFNVK